MAPSFPAQTLREEFANSLTHGLGLLLSVVGCIPLLTLAVLSGEMVHIVGGAVYGSTLVFLYSASTLYHSVRAPRLKYLFRLLDHIGILLLIAGTYTPFLLALLQDGIGWTLLVVIWGVALGGTLFKLFSTHRFRNAAVLLYVVMGWLGVFAIEPLLLTIPTAGVWWLVAGGLAYTVGLIFFGWERLPYSHAIWHVFVLAGSVCHYIAVVRYVLAG